ncbi:MAG: HNH endonuclease [Plesiomonas sp.]|uniref:HNH endonuclease n=1 Tax=Plesiomonas sp. TaxID=2486279 RepID=UPI003F3B4D73
MKKKRKNSHKYKFNIVTRKRVSFELEKPIINRFLFMQARYSERHFNLLDNYGLGEVRLDEFHIAPDLNTAPHEYVLSKRHSSPTEQNEHTSYLYVYEANDINDLSTEEVRAIWNNRYELCGSVEVASEILAIITYLDDDNQQELRPSTDYLTDSEILKIKKHLERTQSIKIDASISYANINTLLKLKDAWLETHKDIDNLNVAELNYVWKNITEHCDSVELASAIYSKLRFLQGYDKIEMGWLHYINAPSIEQLKSKLLSTDTISSAIVQSTTPLLLDRKEKILRHSTIRVTQSDFRTALMKRYNNKCCVTDCTEIATIEAAHIIPYMGEHSNLVDNGLLLRVDIHRLFDKHLLTIDSNSHKIIVSKSMTDTYYLTFSGRTILIPTSCDIYLEHHNNEFFRKDSQID